MDEPRITHADIEAVIASEHYCTAAEGHLGALGTARELRGAADGNLPFDTLLALSHVTICTLVLKNGHKIVGVNTGSVSPDLFDADYGRRAARQAAVDNIYPLLGYQLRERLSRCPSLAATPADGRAEGQALIPRAPD